MTPFNHLDAIAAPLAMANVDTDKIVPSRFLKTVSKAGLDEALFADLRSDPDFILNRPEWAKAGILVALDNFGCGSSREHAPWALAAFGIRCIIAPSFAEIFQGNCRNNGILTVQLTRETVDELLALVASPETSKLAVDLPSQTVTTSDGTVHAFEIADAHKTALLEGLNDIERTVALDDTITAFEGEHRRRQPWLAAGLKV